MSAIDFGRYSQDYAQHRAGYPARFFLHLESFISLTDCRVLDIATGPGIIALELARRGAIVTGIDMAPEQIDAAREKATDARLDDRCSFIVTRAEKYNPPEDTKFDLIIAGQCWRWLDHDAIFRKVRNWLNPGGLFVIANFDFVPGLSPISMATEDIILNHNPEWPFAGKSRMYPEQIEQATGAGFKLIEQICFDHDQPFTHEAWRGRMRTCNGVGSGGMTDDVVKMFDCELEEMLRTHFPEDPLMIPHRVWTVITQPSDTCA